LLAGRYTWAHRNRLTKVEIFSETTGAAVRTVTNGDDMNNRRISRFVDEGLYFLTYGGAVDNRYLGRESCPISEVSEFCSCEGSVNSRY
jgi:hypothetical protein